MRPLVPARRSHRARLRGSLVGAVIATIAVIGSLVVAGPPDAAVAAEVRTPVASFVPAAPGVVKAAPVVGFNPENVISDAVFYDGAAMTSAEIQNFLDAKIGTCNNGKCLNILTAGISSRGAVSSQTTGDLICSAIQGGSMKVSELIYRVQVACGISAKVILTTLQKEQGLTTSKAPSEWNLKAAMGASCPDTAPCDPAFAGVGPQILKGTQQMKTYKAARFGKQPGRNYIGYSPTASCGGTYLDIKNYATAALYTYTPYQPNAAALAAGFGLGNGCSAYGVRNFYNYYTQWFGSTQSTAAFVARDASSGAAYLISQGTRYRFSSEERAAQFTWIAPSRAVSAGELAAFVDGGNAPRAIRTTAGNVYLLDSGSRFRIASCAIAAEFGWNCETLPLLAQGQIEIYHDRGALERVVRSSSSSSWLVQQKVRREVLDLGILARFGISAAATSVSQALVNEYAVAEPVLGPGVYSAGAERTIAVTDAGAFDIPAAARVPAMMSSRRTIQPESLAKVTTPAALPVRANVGGRTYLLSDGGWLAVDAHGTVSFTMLRDGSLKGMPAAGTLSGPHFVREASDTQVYLASSGSLQAMSSADQAWVRARFGVAARVWVVADGALALPKPTGGISVVKSPDGTLYLVDRGQRFRLSGCPQVTDLGIACANVGAATAASISALTDRGSLQMLVKAASGPTWLVQGGTRREVPQVAVLARFGIGSATSVVSPAVIAALPVGDPVLASGAYTDSSVSRAVLVTSGGTYSLTDATRLPVVVAGLRTLTTDSFAKVSVVSALPARVRSGARSLVLTDRGWLQVDAAQFGGDQIFTPVRDGSADGIASAGRQSGPMFVRERSSTMEFLVSGGSIRPVANTAEHKWISTYFGVPTTTWVFADGGLAGIGFTPGYIARNADGTASVYDTAVRYQISCVTAADFGKSCASLPTVTVPASWGITSGGPLAPLLADKSGRAWLVQSGTRREVPDRAVLAPYGITAASTSVSTALLATLPIGAPVLSSGIFDDGAGNTRMITPAGAVYSVPASVRITTSNIRRATLSAASLAKVAAVSGAVPVRISVDSRSYVLSPEGWLSIPAGSYGSLAFAAANNDLVSALPRVVGPIGAHFVREASAKTVYLASGGLQGVADDTKKAWISATYGVPSTVWVVVDGALR